MSETVLFRNIQKNGDKIEFICNKGKRLDPFVGCLIEWRDADHYVGSDILAKGTYYNDCFLPDTFEIYSNMDYQQTQINALKEQLAEANEMLSRCYDDHFIPFKKIKEYQQKWSGKK